MKPTKIISDVEQAFQALQVASSEANLMKYYEDYDDDKMQPDLSIVRELLRGAYIELEQAHKILQQHVGKS